MHHDDHQCSILKGAQTLCCTAESSLDEPGRAWTDLSVRTGARDTAHWHLLGTADAERRVSIAIGWSNAFSKLRCMKFWTKI